MAKEPGKRYATARDLADELRRCLRGEPILARPVGRHEQLWRWAKRNPRVASLSAAVLALLVTVAVGSSIGYPVVSEKKREADQVREAESKISDENRRLAASEGKERDRAVSALRNTQHQLTLNYLQRGVALAEASNPSSGMASLVCALEIAEPEDQLRVSILNLMAGWSDSLGTCLPHNRSISTAVFSPDGKTILTVDAGTVRLWDAIMVSPRGNLHPNGLVHHAAFSPDGETLITASSDGTCAQLWDVATRALRGPPLCHEDKVRKVVFSPNGEFVLTCGGHNIAVWDAASGEAIWAMHRDASVFDVAISPDSRTLVAASSDKTAQIWDAAAGEPRGPALRHEARVGRAIFNSDGKTVLTYCYDDKTARLWDVATGKLRGSPIEGVRDGGSAFYSPDGKIVVAEKSNTVWLYDVPTGEPQGTPLRHEAQVSVVAMSPDSKTILTGDSVGTARLFDAATGQLRVTLRHDGYIWTVQFSPDGKTVLTGSGDHSARLWDVATGELRRAPLHHDGIVQEVAFSSDGKTILTRERIAARLWNASSTEPHSWAPVENASVVAVSPDGRTVVTGNWIWDATTGELRGDLSFAGRVIAAAFSPDGRDGRHGK